MKRKTDSSTYYVHDLAYIVIDLMREAKRDRDSYPKGTEERSFEEGKVFAFCEVLVFMVNQAEAFGMKLEDVGLDKIDPDREMVT